MTGSRGPEGAARFDRARPLEVVAAVITDGKRVMLTRRLPGGHHGGMWEFPGGKVEKGETHREALARELLEELGVEACVTDLVAVSLYDYPHRTIRLSAYLAEISAGVPRPIDCAEIGFFEHGEIKLLTMPDADRPIVDRLPEVMA